jgi:hypothetical protein
MHTAHAKSIGATRIMVKATRNSEKLDAIHAKPPKEQSTPFFELFTIFITVNGDSTIFYRLTSFAIIIIANRIVANFHAACVIEMAHCSAKERARNRRQSLENGT